MNTKFVVFTTVVVLVSVILSLNSRDSYKILEVKGDELELIPIDGGATGPESIAFDGNGEGPYTGVSDGRILKWQGKKQGWMEYSRSSSSPDLVDKCRGSIDPQREPECGRPLGVQFDDMTGELYIADAYLGLLVTALDNNVSNPVVSETHGNPLRFINSLDIEQETRVIYFTDSSRTYQRREFMSAIISGDKTGRLLKYDPRANKVEVLLDGLSFPNGLALSKDGSFLLVGESTTGRILKYWLQSPKTATLEVVAELPGFTDNIKRSPRGGFWVALHSKRGKLVQWALSFPWLKQVLLKIPDKLQRVSALLNEIGPQVAAVRLSEDGQIIEALQGDVRKKVRFISEVHERNGSLWIGSVISPFIGLYHL